MSLNSGSSCKHGCHVCVVSWSSRIEAHCRENSQCNVDSRWGQVVWLLFILYKNFIGIFVILIASCCYNRAEKSWAQTPTWELLWHTEDQLRCGRQGHLRKSYAAGNQPTAVQWWSGETCENVKTQIDIFNFIIFYFIIHLFNVFNLLMWF